ncbi:hypothetical protein A3194_00190 [Candidatus Thiodiazotropha endoloripes]|nr:hypothetical protein A3194_00190 [Candidatus Thiodiazotropha endoloripes]
MMPEIFLFQNNNRLCILIWDGKVKLPMVCKKIRHCCNNRHGDRRVLNRPEMIVMKDVEEVLSSLLPLVVMD